MTVNEKKCTDELKKLAQKYCSKQPATRKIMEEWQRKRKQVIKKYFPQGNEHIS